MADDGNRNVGATAANNKITVGMATMLDDPQTTTDYRVVSPFFCSFILQHTKGRQQ